MKCEAVKVVVRPHPPQRILVEKKVVLPPVRVNVPGIQGAKGDRGEPASVDEATKEDIDLIFGVENGNGK